MKEILLQLLKVSYASVGFFAIIAYWPTIKDLYKHKKPSANIQSYILWTGTAGISFLYSLFILPDLLFQFVSSVNLLACLLVVFLTLKLKKSKQ